jgi:ADP-ribose pyrophosphatase YjhB (NUDIX family)
MASADRHRQIVAHGVYREPDGEILLLDGALPSGAVRHGEHPAAAVVRLFAEQAGLTVAIRGVLEASSELFEVPGDGGPVHHDRIVFEVADADDEPPAARLAVPPDGRLRVQRFAVYGLVTDPDGRILLARIATGYPGAGRWHLPGGGTDFGEQPVEALLREITEETAQVGRVTELLGVSDRHNPNGLSRDGYPVDWHAVRLLYRVVVDVPSKARVTEAAGGSTEQAAWFAPDEIPLAELSEIAGYALRTWPPHANIGGLSPI